MSDTQDKISDFEHLTHVFKLLFDPHPANVCMLDLNGKIVAVNKSWSAYATENGVTEGFQFEGLNYLEMCTAAAEQGDSHASQALTGLLDVMATGRAKFVMTYPCHAPHEKRWYRLWVEPQMPSTPAIIVAHQLERAEPVFQ